MPILAKNTITVNKYLVNEVPGKRGEIMMENSGKKKIVALLAPVGLVVGLSLGTVQDADAGYLTTSRGEVVTNGFGECWNAKGGLNKAMAGCGDVVAAKPEKDSDGDGVVDSRDECPGTPRGVEVNKFGCAMDSDGDGVPNYKDKCPGTRAGARVNMAGCEIVENITIKTTADHFDFDSATLKPAMKSALDNAAAKINASPGNEQVRVVGHTDSVGSDAYNQGLSERRAQSAADYLSGRGVGNISTSGMGERSPAADNGTRDGRAMNRRVEIQSQ